MNELRRRAGGTKEFQITLTTNNGAWGTAGGGGAYKPGQTATVTASPQSGYYFVAWTESGGTVSTSASYSFTVEGDRTLVAVFAAYILITASSADATMGSVGGAGNYIPGSTVTLVAYPITDPLTAFYGFVNWTENGSAVSTSATYSFTASANRTLVANFVLIPPNLRDNLQLLWNFDGNVNETASNIPMINDGVTFTSGKINQCAVFNGSNHARLGMGRTINIPAPLTIAFWIKCPNQENDPATIIANTNNAYINIIEQNRLSVYSTRVNLPDDEWTHICIVSTNSGVSDGKYYVNGVETAGQWIHFNLGAYFRIGSSQGIPVDECHFKGNLDQLCVWDKELTRREVNYLYNSGQGRNF